MDMIVFGASAILMTIKQFVKNPKSAAKYKSILLSVANAILALYADAPGAMGLTARGAKGGTDDDKSADDHADEGLALIFKGVK